MLFSVIIPSFLGQYQNAASNREQKIHRCLASVLNQSYEDFEVIFVADGCQKSYDIISEYSDERIRSYLIPKQKLFSGQVRNFGLSKAQGKYIVYADIDDCLGSEHLEIISREVSDYGWVYFDDYVGRKDSTFILRPCQLDRKYGNGTSNICHKRELNAIWPDGYLHDYLFIESLKKAGAYKKISTPQYYVCHVPQQVDI